MAALTAQQRAYCKAVGGRRDPTACPPFVLRMRLAQQREQVVRRPPSRIPLRVYCASVMNPSPSPLRRLRLWR